MKIRKATLQDAVPIAQCLLLAMEDIVFRFIGKQDHQMAYEFMHYFVQREQNQYSWQNCRVAENENGVVGAINIYDGARLEDLRKPILVYLHEKYNQEFIPEDETQPGEIYIDTLGVHPDHQGKGIGKALLKHLIAEYVELRGETLGILVEDENTIAKKLYLELGFQKAGLKTLMGKKMEHLVFNKK
jgi:ribosomal protein S18 acetylase RimI-like enzyme